jgi:hypothetical protein
MAESILPTPETPELFKLRLEFPVGSYVKLVNYRSDGRNPLGIVTGHKPGDEDFRSGVMVDWIFLDGTSQANGKYYKEHLRGIDVDTVKLEILKEEIKHLKMGPVYLNKIENIPSIGRFSHINEGEVVLACNEDPDDPFSYRTARFIGDRIIDGVPYAIVNNGKSITNLCFKYALTLSEYQERFK